MKLYLKYRGCNELTKIVAVDRHFFQEKLMLHHILFAIEENQLFAIEKKQVLLDSYTGILADSRDRQLARLQIYVITAMSLSHYLLLGR